MHNDGNISSSREHYGYSASEQFQNRPFDSLNNESNFVSAFQIAEAENEMLRGTPADTEAGLDELVRSTVSWDIAWVSWISWVITDLFLVEGHSSITLQNLRPIGLTLTPNADSSPEWVNRLPYQATSVSGSSSRTCHDVNNYGSQKFKASNFSASSLRIGSWKEVPVRQDGLVAKCYYSKKTFVWEILKGGLKSKIEIQWSNIIGIRASIVEGRRAILEFELNEQPTFFKETVPVPRRHTIWNVSQDFTDGQALIYRRHYAEFPPGVLNKHYETLLKCDSRLLKLSETPFPTLSSPYFQSDFYPEQYSFDFSGHGSNLTYDSQLPSLSSTVPRPVDASQQAQGYEQTNQLPCLINVRDSPGDGSLISDSQGYPAGTSRQNYDESASYVNGGDGILISDYQAYPAGTSCQNLDESASYVSYVNGGDGILLSDYQVHHARTSFQDYNDQSASYVGGDVWLIPKSQVHHQNYNESAPYIGGVGSFISDSQAHHPAITSQNYNMAGPDHVDGVMRSLISNSEVSDLHGMTNGLQMSDDFLEYMIATEELPFDLIA
ncbi:hypothetical protein CJ030_MR0G007931 [Morella rubra]|uniref:TRF2/HOY1 PH-like domain-containing protein n=1 Tax=Morella rubra TaxID=262757 RepID=A0A6A1UIT8_9ROSI|nr:hypothetical protein CJ030_MR0G007931 [Morella rubra]